MKASSLLPAARAALAGIGIILALTAFGPVVTLAAGEAKPAPAGEPNTARAGKAKVAPARPADPEVEKLVKELAGRGWILFSSQAKGTYDLFLSRPDGSAMRNITNTPDASEFGGRFSPDGTKILYRRLPRGQGFAHDMWGAQGRLVIADADGANPVVQGKDGEFPWASWGPDGKQIACLDKRQGKIVIYDLATRKAVKEMPRKGIFQQLYWSPDGKRLCGTANVNGADWNIVSVDLAGGEATLLSRQLNCTSDWFQGDPTRVIYSHRDPALEQGDSYGWTSLWQASADGKTRTLLYGEHQHIYFGCTSPDDQYVLLTRAPGDGGINRQMAIIRLADTPIIVPPFEALKEQFPGAKEGPVFHWKDLPLVFEPHWTYAKIGGE